MLRGKIHQRNKDKSLLKLFKLIEETLKVNHI